MIVRQEPDGGILTIGQPAHAALAGRLAEAWDDELAPGLLLAATHHDDVWSARDAAPPLSPGTGRPETFLELSDHDRHVVWSRAAEVAAPLGPAAELWVLRHAVRLHAHYADPALKAMVASLDGRAGELVEELRPTHPGRFEDFELSCGTALLALFDTLALRLCFGVEAAADAGVLRLTPTEGAVTVAPWPFAGDRLETFVEARRLPDALPNQAALDAAWAAAEPVALPLTLLPPS